MVFNISTSILDATGNVIGTKTRSILNIPFEVSENLGLPAGTLATLIVLGIAGALIFGVIKLK